jgi:hypothetical protein
MRLMTILLLTAAGTLACEAGPASPGAPPNGELPTRSRDVPVDKATDVQRVAWPARASIDAAPLARLSPKARGEVEKSSIPVLVPAAMADAAKLVVRPAFTAVSITGTGEHLGLTVSVSATRVAHRYQNTPRAQGPERVRGDKPAFITQNERIWSATWRENGVSYVVEVECARPDEDARCESDAFLRTVVEDLAFVGGAFEGGAQ